MPILTGNNSIKLMCSNHKVSKIYCQNSVIYSSGNIVTYVCYDSNYTEEVDEGGSCLSPSFEIPSKPNYTFSGWSDSPNGAVLTSKIMGDDPVTLYAVYIGNPHVFPLTSNITWTAQGISNGVNRGKQTFTGVGTAYIPSWNDDETVYQVTANEICLNVKRPEGGQWKSANLSTAIPTGGCKYLDISYRSTNSTVLPSASVNGTNKSGPNGSTGIYQNFYVGGKSTVSIFLSAQDAGSGLGGAVYFTRLYFHN